MMCDETVIANELREIKDTLEKVVDGSELVTCVRAHIRVNIARTQQKSLGVCLQFPPDGYPVSPIILELKSKTIGDLLCLLVCSLVSCQSYYTSSIIVILFFFLFLLIIDYHLFHSVFHLIINSLFL